MDEVPSELRYTAEHEWVAPIDDTTVRVGITHYAQQALGDIVFVNLPSPGTAVTQMETFGEVESTKSVSDIYAPISGVVRQRNEVLDGQPELVNRDPYGGGWLVELELSQADSTAAMADLLDAAGYAALIAQ